MFDSSAERRPQRVDQATIDEPNHPTNPAAIVILAPATMPAAPQLFEPAGLRPDQPRGDMDTQSTINPLASSDVGGAAGRDAAACVRARGECDGERVCYARGANCVLSSTTQSLSARQVVVPQAQNSGASAAAIMFVPQPSTIENAGADASEASISQRSVHFTTDPPVDDEEGWTKYFGKTARGRAKRSAKCGTSVPSAVPAAPAVRRPTRSSFRPAAGITSLDAVAPPVTPSVPSAAVPLPPWGGVAYDRNGAPTHPAGVAPFDAVAPSVSIPVPTPAGVAPFDAVAPSVAPTALRIASTNDSPISQPTGDGSRSAAFSFYERLSHLAAGGSCSAASRREAHPLQNSALRRSRISLHLIWYGSKNG